MSYYVYCLFRPWNGEPCYIGKGKGRRLEDHARLGQQHYNGHLASVFAKAGGPIPAVIIRDGLTEAEAFATEVALIAAIGRADSGNGPLCNWTDGGEGATGYRFRAEQIERLEVASRRRWDRPGERKKIADYHAGLSPAERTKRATTIAAATRIAMRDAEVRERCGSSHRGIAPSDDLREKNRQGQLAAHERDPTLRHRQARFGRKPMLGKKHSEETRARMRAAHAARKAASR